MLRCYNRIPRPPVRRLLGRQADLLTRSVMILSKIFSKILRSVKRRPSQAIVALFLAGLLVGIFCSCSTTKTIPLETLRHDTLYINKEHYDSIYITRTSDTDRTCDTITITKTMTEYRFRLIRDTIRIARIDSIPYEVRIREVKEVEHPPSFYDRICSVTFWMFIGFIFFWIYRKVHKT